MIHIPYEASARVSHTCQLIGSNHIDEEQPNVKNQCDERGGPSSDENCFNHQVLQIKLDSKTIADKLDKTVSVA